MSWICEESGAISCGRGLSIRHPRGPVTQREPAGRQHQLVPQDIIDDANEKAKAAMEESDDDDDDDDAMAT